MSAQPAYDYAERAYERERASRPNISVVPGARRGVHSQASTLPLTAIAVCVAVVLLVVACLGVARVTLSAAAVSAAVESQELTSSIETARTEGSRLEVEQSALSNPTHVKEAASALGMGVAAETTMIDVSGDVVVTDEAGSLSLSGSMAAAAASGE